METLWTCCVGSCSEFTQTLYLTLKREKRENGDLVDVLRGQLLRVYPKINPKKGNLKI